MDNENNTTSSKKQILIKRYQNRKLYDTHHSTYVTLKDISKAIKLGHDVQIIDNHSKKDLTHITLTQIIFEEEKSNQCTLPIDILKRIICSGSDAFDQMASEALALSQAERSSGNGAVTEDSLVTPELEPEKNPLQDEVRVLRQRIHYLEKKLKTLEKH